MVKVEDSGVKVVMPVVRVALLQIVMVLFAAIANGCECRPVFNKPSFFKGRNTRISVVLHIKGMKVHYTELHLFRSV